MATYNAEDVLAILEEAHEQINLYDGGRSHVEFYNLPVSLETPEDWLAWLIHDADLHERMASDQKYPECDQLCFWQDAALMRKYVIALLLEGLKPTEIKWRENFEQCNANCQQ